MKKQNRMAYLALGIVFIVFNVLAFAIPTEKTGTFWTAYVFTLLAFAAQIGIWYIAFGKAETLKSKFLGIPLLHVGVAALIVQLIAFAVFMAVQSLPVWAAVVTSAIIFGGAGICLIAGDVGRDEVQRVEEKVNRKVFYLKDLQTDIELLPGNFHENIHHHLSKESGDVKTIYVPIQVIYYTYRGNPYQAAMILTQENCFAFSYPRFVKKEESQPKELKKTSGPSKSTLPYLIGLYAFFVFCLIKASGAGSNQESTIWLVLGFCAGILAVIWQLISSTRKKARLTAKKPQETDKTLEESEQKMSELELEYQAFLETLTNTKSVEAAVAAAKNFAALVPEAGEILNSTFTSSDLKKVMDLHTNL